MKIFLIILAFLAAIILIVSSIRIFGYICRCKKAKIILSGERSKKGFLYELYSSVFGRKCYILKNIYVLYKNDRNVEMLCVPLLLLGSGGILIIEEKHMCGFIEDPMRGDWRQFHGNRIVQFYNPIEDNSKRMKALGRLIRNHGLNVPAMKGMVVFTHNDVRLKNRLRQVYSAESSIKCIRSFMKNKSLTSGEMKSLCAFIRRESRRILNSN